MQYLMLWFSSAFFVVKNKPSVEELLAPSNVDPEKLKSFALEIGVFSTKLPNFDFKINHHGRPDVAMFDFTSVYQACHAAVVRDVNGHKLLAALVGDGLYQVTFFHVLC